MIEGLPQEVSITDRRELAKEALMVSSVDRVIQEVEEQVEANPSSYWARLRAGLAKTSRSAALAFLVSVSPAGDVEAQPLLENDIRAESLFERFPVLKELSKECHLVIEVEADKTMPAVLFIGQSHMNFHSDMLDAGLGSRKRIADIQEKITDVLATLGRNGITGIYTEGVQAEDGALEGLALSREWYVKSAQDFTSLPREISTLPIFIKKSVSLFDSAQLDREKYNRSAFHLVWYSFRAALKDFYVLARENHASLDSRLIEQIEDIKEQVETIYTLYGQDDSPFYEGATHVGFMEGKVNVLPAEEIGPRKLIDAIESKLFEEAKKGAPSSALDELKKERERVILDVREDKVLEIIGKKRWSPEDLIPLVFGSLHDFSDNVKSFNEKEGQTKFGLIRCDVQEKND